MRINDIKGIAPPNKTSDEEAAIIREEYRRGDPVPIIADRSGVTTGVVHRICEDLEQPRRKPPLGTTAIADMLAGWPAP